MEDKIIQVLKDALEIEDHDIKASDEFRMYDEWDSLGRLSLIAEIDTEFEVQIEDEAFEKLTTVQDLIDEIKKSTASES